MQPSAIRPQRRSDAALPPAPAHRKGARAVPDTESLTEYSVMRVICPMLSRSMVDDPAQQDRLEMLEYGMAAAGNARDLLHAAAVLLDHQHWPQAYAAMSVLACEEAGKAWLSVSATAAGAEPWKWPAALKARRNHVVKLIAAAWWGAGAFEAVDEEPGQSSSMFSGERLAELARGAERTKRQGLYVDAGDGGVWRPRKIDEDLARGMVAWASQIVTDITGPWLILAGM
jgi:AbiV family abortive infection protein